MLRLGASLSAVFLLAAACSGAETTDDAEPTMVSTTARAQETTTSTTSAVGDERETRAAVSGLPDSAVGERFGQILTASLDGSLSEELIVDSATEFFIEQISPATLLSASAQLPPLLGLSPVVSGVQTATEHHLVGTLLNPTDGSTYSFVAGVEVEPPHRLVTFGVVPERPPVADASIDDLDAARAAWAALASDGELLIEEIGPNSEGAECGVGGQPLAIGSAVKFYVLGAVAGLIESGAREWSDDVVIEDRLRSLPSGQLQVEEAGAVLSVIEAAELMLGISDNTATDHLIDLVGRESVEAELEVLGHGSPELNRPFLTSTELFKLKLGDPIRLGFYAEGGESERREILADLVSEPLPEIEPGDFLRPRAIDVEWLASGPDLCRAVVGLDARSEQQPEIARALRANRGLPLSREDWPVVAFKGGSEPGVLNLTWLVEHADGRRFVVSGTANDASSTIDQGAALAIAARVFELLAQA